MRVKFQGSFTNGIYFSAKVSNVMSWVNCKLGGTERRQSAVSNWSILLLFRHPLLAASNCGVVVVPSPHRVGSRTIGIGSPIFSSNVLGVRGSEL